MQDKANAGEKAEFIHDLRLQRAAFAPPYCAASDFFNLALVYTEALDPDHTDFENGITAIDTGYMGSMIDASHLIVEGDRAAFVDTGTSYSVPRLLRTLESKNLDPGQVDYVLVTHVHLDHAGGAGQLIVMLPNATAIVHPRGARHLADPARLVAGATAVYGAREFSRLYGDIVPIEESRLRTVHDGEILELQGRALEFIHTEGHARHHYCVVDRQAEAIFSGDSFGVSYRIFDTDRGAFIFPTTTPVQFDPDPAHEAVDRLMSYAPEAIYLTHYSRVCGLERLAQDMHECLDGFVSIARAHAGAPDREAGMAEDLYRFLASRLDAHGFDTDEARRRALLKLDIGLNVQGLCVWLDRDASSR